MASAWRSWVAMDVVRRSPSRRHANFQMQNTNTIYPRNTGKSSLLKRLASKAIKGFPSYLQISHVTQDQELQFPQESALNALVRNF